jgi:RNA polymerase sigma-70 factor (ECF subfamily)
LSDGPLPGETRLLKQAAQGDLDAFASIVEAYRPRVQRIAYGAVGNAQEADDVAQDVFVKVWQNLDRYVQGASFASWLYRITVNTAIDRLRRRRPSVSLDDLSGEAISDPSGERPEQVTLQRDTTQRVRRAIAALPPAARMTLLLREYEQLSYKEIAEVLQVPIGTVMSRLNYARQALKRSLADQEDTNAL